MAAPASFLLLHGLEGSSPDHWQTWLAGRLAASGHAVRFPALPEPMAPSLDAWLGTLAEELAALRAAPGEHVVIAHSLGCILWLHHAAAPVRAGDPALDRVLLVAPPSPAAAVREIEPFWPVPADPGLEAVGRRTELVCADDDPYCPEGAQARYGAPLGLTTHLITGGAHLNPDAGLGPWPAVERWCREGLSAFAPGAGEPAVAPP